MRHFRAFLACALALVAFAAAPAASAAGVAADISVHVSGRYSGSNALGSVSLQFDQAKIFQLSPGTALGQANLFFADSRVIAASGTDSLDLAGTLTDAFGTVISCGHVKSIYVFASKANVNSVIMGAGTNPFVGPLGGTTPTVTIPPGGFALFVHPGAGWPVTAATADILKLANSAGTTSVSYDIALTCTST